MPTFNSLTQEQRDFIIDEIELKMEALQIADRKLGKRLRTVPGLKQSQITAIKLAKTRIGIRIDILDDRLEEFELNKVAIKPPTEAQLEAMKQKVEKIRKINVTNKSAKAIVNATVAVAGSLPK